MEKEQEPDRKGPGARKKLIDRGYVPVEGCAGTGPVGSGGSGARMSDQTKKKVHPLIQRTKEAKEKKLWGNEKTGLKAPPPYQKNLKQAGTSLWTSP